MKDRKAKEVTLRKAGIRNERKTLARKREEEVIIVAIII